MRTFLYVKSTDLKILNYSIPNKTEIILLSEYFNQADPSFNTGAEITNPASIAGTAAENFTITVATNDKLKIDINNLGVEVITLTPIIGGTAIQVGGDIVDKINAAFGSEVVYCDVNAGKITIATLKRGTGAEIDLQSITNSCYATLGFSVGITNGNDTGIGVDYNEKYFKVSSENTESVVKARLAALNPIYVKRADAESAGKKLQPKRVIVGIQYDHVVETSIGEISHRRFEGIIGLTADRVFHLLVRKVKNNDLTAGEETELNSFISSADTIQTEFDDETALL